MIIQFVLVLLVWPVYVFEIQIRGGNRVTQNAHSAIPAVLGLIGGEVALE